MPRIETVAIDRNGRKVTINKSDYDPDKHALWGADKPATEKRQLRKRPHRSREQ